MGFGCIQFQNMPSSKVLPGEESDFQNLDKVNLTEEADVEAEDVNATDKADDTDISQTDDKEPGYEEPSGGICGGLCCVRGCVYGLIGFIYVCFCIPSGIFLVFYGSGSELLIVVGISLLVLPPMTIPTSIYLMKRFKKRYTAIKQSSLQHRHLSESPERDIV